MISGQYLRSFYRKGVVIPHFLRKEIPLVFLIRVAQKGYLLLEPPAEMVSPGGIVRPVNTNGRISIPPDLAKKAHLGDKQVVVVACGDYIELWDPSRWDKEEKKLGSILGKDRAR